MSETVNTPDTPASALARWGSMTPVQRDAVIATLVMRWRVFRLEDAMHDGNTPRPHCLVCPVPDGTEALQVFRTGAGGWWLPSQRVADSWEAIEEMAHAGWYLELWTGRRGDSQATFHKDSSLSGDNRTGHGEGPSAPDAICQAALAALAGEGK